MEPDARTTPILPTHIEQTVQAIARLQAEHLRGATPAERALSRITKIVAKPRFLVGLTVTVALWVGGNLLLIRLGISPLDPPPFPWMDSAASISALYMTAVILSAQTREDQLSNLREQLTLELGILAEQKASKTIELLEAIRRDTSIIPDRVDEEADAMAKPADPQSVLEAIRETQEVAEQLDADTAP